MKPWRSSGRQDLVIDLGLSSLKMRYGARGLELPVRRGPDGRILAECRAEVCEAVRQFLGTRSPVSGGRRRRQAVCGIPSRGVSLRSISLPQASRDETERLLRFQIEREFPLPPDELAFSCRCLETNGALPSPAGSAKDFIVAALRREALDEYASMFSECGLGVSFALGSLAASRVCSFGSGSGCVLDIGRTHSELVDVVDGAPRAVRCLSWGGESVTEAIAATLGVQRDRAEEIKIELAGEGERADRWRSLDATRSAQGVEKSVEDLARRLRECWRAGPPGNGSGAPSELILTGRGSRLSALPELLERSFGGAVRCRRIEPPPGTAVSAVTLGLERQSEARDRGSALRFEVASRTASEPAKVRRFALARWIAAVVLLLLISLGLRFAPPLLDGASLDARIREREALLAAQPDVGRELGFLEMVQSNQTPYLDVLAVIARSAPPGSFISELSMHRRGDASMRGKVGNVAQLEELRKKLSLSGWFDRVVIQERTPRKKFVDFQLVAQFRSKRANTATGSQPEPSEAPSPKTPSPGTPSPGTAPSGAPASKASPPGVPGSQNAEGAVKGGGQKEPAKSGTSAQGQTESGGGSEAEASDGTGDASGSRESASKQAERGAASSPPNADQGSTANADEKQPDAEAGAAANGEPPAGAGDEAGAAASPGER